MKALRFHFSYARFAIAKMLGQLGSGGYLTSLGPLAYETVPDPGIVGDDWVVVQTRYSGVCGSDVKQVFLDGAMDNPMTSLISFPHVLGHETVGTVVEVGKQVRRVKKGDRIACYPWLSCEVRGLPPCPPCQRGELTHCLGFTEGRFAPGIHAGNCRDVPGGFAPFLPAHESMCFRIPDAVSFEKASVADPFAVSLHSVLKAPPQPGETAVVFGCGALGVLLVHILRQLFQDVTIIAVDRAAYLGELATAMGADRFSTRSGADFVEEMGELTKSKVHRPMKGMPWLLSGVDRVYDTVGAPSTLEAGLRVVRPCGTIVMSGVSTPRRFEWTPLYFKEVVLIGSNGCAIETHNGQRAHGFELFLSMLEQERVDPAPIVTHTFPLDDYRAAFTAARDKSRHQSVKVAFDFDAA